MIVSCPGCSTHYSHGEEDALRIGRCSQCDERFALSGPKRHYMVMPAVASGPADPLLAVGLAATETLVDRQIAPDLPFPSDGADSVAEDDQGFFGSSLDDDEALFGIEAARDDGIEPPQAAADDEPARARPAHPVREALGVFVLAGLGGVAGFNGSLRFGFEPLSAIGIGLGLGLTFGWAWIRWAERKR